MIQRLYNKNANCKVKIMDGMQQQPDWKPDGKRLFLDRTNQSHTENMYPILDAKEGGTDFFYRRVTDEYPKKSAEDYEAPPVSKIFEEKNTFVHN
jgi:hypothetical protein